MPEAPTDLAARMLRPARDALSMMIDLAHVELNAVGRVALGGNTDRVDEIRLAAIPRDRMPGLRAIELALAPCPHGGAMPEVFVRFDDASAAADCVARIASNIPVVCGRSPEERVVRLIPDEPTARSAATLMAHLLESLEGRRRADRTIREPSTANSGVVTPIRWRGVERRRSRPTLSAALAI